VSARLLAATDAFHAMTEDRPHRPALSGASGVAATISCSIPLAALPPIFLVRPAGAARPWVESSLPYVLEATGWGADSQVLMTLRTIVLTEVLRLHIGATPAADPEWLTALRDPVLSSSASRARPVVLNRSEVGHS
jgi:hypothetical protein